MADKIYCFYDCEPVFCWMRFRELFIDKYGRPPGPDDEDKYGNIDFKDMSEVDVFPNYTRDEYAARVEKARKK